MSNTSSAKEATAPKMGATLSPNLNVATVVTAQRHNHPSGAYSFRIERNGRVFVVCTDVEHGEQIDPRLVDLARGVDLLVHDAQYTAGELQKRRG